MARLPVDLTLVEGGRLARWIGVAAPWSGPWGLAVACSIAVAGLATHGGMLVRAVGWRVPGIGSLAFAFALVVVGILLREIARGAAAARNGRRIDAIRVALRPRAVPAFHTEMHPAWHLGPAEDRARITAAGCAWQAAFAGVLVLALPLAGGAGLRIAALVTLALVAWTALTGERAFLAAPPAMRGAQVVRVHAAPTPPRAVGGTSHATSALDGPATAQGDAVHAAAPAPGSHCEPAPTDTPAA